MGHKRIVLGALGLGLLGLGAYTRRRQLLARALKLPPPRYAVEVEFGVRVPMRDGIALVADHYAPTSAGPFPTVLMRTPYGRGSRGGVLGMLHVFAAQRFAERGYHVIVEDTRGRFDSEGEFEPFVDEEQDGRDTLDWISRQPWFDGNLGMWGQSYEGYVQWAVAADAPGFLKALVPSITGSQLTPYTGSAFSMDTILRWIYNLSRGGVTNPGREDFQRMLDPQIVKSIVAPAFEHLPLEEADALIVGRTLPYYRKWLSYAHMDHDFWRSLYHGTRMDRVTARVHLVSGWYDILLHQLLDDYDALCAAGHTPYLTIGPWLHQDPRGAAEALRAGIFWMDAQLKGIRRRLRTQPVRLYVMTAGGGTWRDLEQFPPASMETRLYLQSGSKLAYAPDVDGSLPDHYRYDPTHPTPSVGGPLYHREGGSHDNRALEARPDVLTYTTPPLTSDLEVIGRVRMELFAASSAASADFFARLCDVYPDGRSMNVCDGLVRVENPDPSTPSDSRSAISIDMWAMAYRFQSGHCLRVQVSSGAYPRWDRNLGTGEPIRTGTRMVTADQTIYHDSTRPSAIVLPVCKSI